MLLATVITVVMSAVFRSTTETQLTKLEEDNQKALAAAEAGVEAAIKKAPNANAYTFTDLGLNINGFNGNVTVSQVSNINKFVSPLIQKDQQYTFYLDNYVTNTFQNTPYVDYINVYYDSQRSAPGNCNGVVIETTLLNGSAPTVIKRFAADSGNVIGSNPADRLTVSYGFYSLVIANVTTNFNCKAVFSSPISTYMSNAKVMLVRVLSTIGSSYATKLGFEGVNGSGSPVNLKPQGKYVNSQAQSTVGVGKSVQLFQSNPQIPAEFFVTSFDRSANETE
jgi:hypothetical protein